MPFSLPAFDDVLAQHLKRLGPARVLDVGAGAGKHGKIVRQHIQPQALEAIEPTASYIEQFQLRALYNTVYNLTIQEFIQAHSRQSYNLVIIGDVLEHLFRSEVLDVVDCLLYRTDWLLALWPTNMPQNDEYENNRYEIHKSNFKLADLAAAFDVHYYQKKFFWFQHEKPEYSACEYHYCVLRGHTTRRNMGF